MRITRAGSGTAGAAFQPVDHTWAPGLVVKAGQLVEHAGSLYTVDADMTLPGVFDTTGLTAVGGGGGGSVPLTMSQVPLFSVASVASQVLASGGAPAVEWDPTTKQQGDAWWGVTGSALDLGFDVGTDVTRLLYPDMVDGAVYDLAVTVQGATDPAEAGKIVIIAGNSWGMNGSTAAAVIAADGTFRGVVSWVDATFKGDTGASITPVTVDTTALTHDIVLEPGRVLILQRVGPG